MVPKNSLASDFIMRATSGFSRLSEDEAEEGEEDGPQALVKKAASARRENAKARIREGVDFIVKGLSINFLYMPIGSANALAAMKPGRRGITACRRS
jgi:hypothetical protein